MEFTDNEFKELTLRVDLMPPRVDPLEYFPRLAIYKEFSVKLRSPLRLNKIIRFIGYIYQEKTPLRIIDNFTRRKFEAAKLAGFDTNLDGSLREQYQEIINCENKVVNKMIIRWCRMLKQTAFSKLCVYENTYYDEMEALLGCKDTTEKKNIRINIEAFGADIDKISNDLLVEDTNKMLLEDLLDDVENKELEELRPEGLAIKRKYGEELVDVHPYGAGYKFEKHKNEAIKD